MRRSLTCISMMVLGLGILAGCAVSSSEPEVEKSPAGVTVATQGPGSRTAEPKTPMAATYSMWIAIPNDFNDWTPTGPTTQPSATPFPGYTFAFPTPWLEWIGAPDSGYDIDFDAFFYEHDELLPIQYDGSQAAYSFQWYVASVTTDECYVGAGTGTAAYPSTCIDSITSLHFLTPFDNGTAATQQALQTAEATWLGQASDVDAGLAIHPLIYELIPFEGGFLTGKTAGGVVQLVINMSGPVAEYPLADVHDPKNPPI